MFGTPLGVLNLLIVDPVVDLLLGVIDNVIECELVPGTDYAHLHLPVADLLDLDKAVEDMETVGLYPAVNRQLVVAVLVHPLTARAVHIQVLVIVLAADDVEVFPLCKDVLHVLALYQV